MQQKGKEPSVFDRLKRKLRVKFGLISIPKVSLNGSKILFGKNTGNLRYISYSIPLACIMILLFGLVYSIIFIDSGFNNDEVYAESITSSNSNASLTITENDLHTTAAPGSVAYASTNVSYSTTNVENYTLKISYANGSSALVGDSADATSISDVANNALLDNSWGYAWSDDSNVDEDGFNNLTYTSVPSYNNGNNLAQGSTNISNGTGKLIFAAKFANNAVTTNYKTSVLLALATTPKAVTYTLTYNANNGTGAPSSQACATTDVNCSITISSTKPTRTGHTFLGWANSNSATTAAYVAGDATKGTITMIGNKTIYAVWEENIPTVSGFGGIKKMQDMTSSVCSSASGSGQLYDDRGKEVYTVKKIGSECWMTQNLRLKGGRTLTNSDTDAADGYTLNYYLQPSLTSLSSGNFSNNNYHQDETYYNSSTYSTNGVYYSFTAATAGWASSSVTYSTTLKASICPKGWTIPTSTQTGNTSSGLANYSFVTSGYANADSSIKDAGSAGYYWVSRVESLTNASVMYYGGSVSSNSMLSRAFGLTVRCVAK